MPRQTSTSGSIVVVATAWAYVASFTLPLPAAVATGSVLPLLALGGVLIRSPQAFQLALFCTLVALGGLLLPVGLSMPGLAVGILAYLLLCRTIPRLRGGASWLRAGTMTPAIGRLMALTVLVAAAGLVGWFWLSRPDVGELLAFLEGIPGWLLPAVALSFSALNAAAEEAVFRGAMLHGLDAALGPGWGSIVMQAGLFGVWHVHGFPSGLLGSGLVFFYALLLGVIRRRSQGLLAVWVTHVFADMVILGILLWLT